MSQYWSWGLTSVGAFGLYLAGRKLKAGWAVGLCAQALWLAYAIATRQWGFIASVFIYGSVYAKNFLRWRTENKASAVPALRTHCEHCKEVTLSLTPQRLRDVDPEVLGLVITEASQAHQCAQAVTG